MKLRIYVAQGIWGVKKLSNLTDKNLCLTIMLKLNLIVN